MEDVVSEGMDLKQIAAMIDKALGTKAIMSIPAMGWIANMDWSPLARHVFHLEFFLNDPPASGDWNIPDVQLCKQLQEHAHSCGVKKVAMLCGVYPAKRVVTSTEYKAIIKSAGAKFGGIYLGDNNGPDYAQWG